MVFDQQDVFMIIFIEMNFINIIITVILTINTYAMIATSSGDHDHLPLWAKPSLIKQIHILGTYLRNVVISVQKARKVWGMNISFLYCILKAQAHPGYFRYGTHTFGSFSMSLYYQQYFFTLLRSSLLHASYYILFLLFPFAVLGNQFPFCNYMNWSFQRR